MKIVLTGGGTGGHFYPLIAVAESLRAIEQQQFKAGYITLFYIGPDPYDQNALTEQNIIFVQCPAGKLRRYFSLKNIGDLFITIGGFFVATGKLFFIYPDVILSKGGYTSIPVILAAWFLRIPLVVHESDSRPGKANKLASRFARTIAISYEDARRYFKADKTILTGIPIRKAFFQPQIIVPNERPTILILGGSQGAERINDQILLCLKDLLTRYTIIHQTGPANLQVVTEAAQTLVPDAISREHYILKGFLDAKEIVTLMTQADLVISRGGSGTIHEIAIKGKPSILLPIPEDISHDQRTNAYAYARTGSSVVIEEGNLTPHLLIAEIDLIMQDLAIRKKMTEGTKLFALANAAETIATTLISIGQEHE